MERKSELINLESLATSFTIKGIHPENEIASEALFAILKQTQ